MTPIVEELKVVLTGCIGELHALVGVDVNVLLLTSAGVRVSVQVVAGLVADILIVSSWFTPTLFLLFFFDIVCSLSSVLSVSSSASLRAPSIPLSALFSLSSGK